MKYLALPFTLLLLIASCANQDVCDDDNQSYLVARFKTLEGSVTRDTIMAEITIYGIREGKTDSLLYNSTSTSRIELPLDPNNDITSFVFSNSIRGDTLFISQLSEVYLINYTCGFASRFTLEEVSSAGKWMLKVDVKDGNIDSELQTDEEHLWIYF